MGGRLDWERAESRDRRRESTAGERDAARGRSYGSAAYTPCSVRFKRGPKGQWFVFGPARLIQLGGEADVRKRDGTKQRVRFVKVMPMTRGNALAIFVNVAPKPAGGCSICGELAFHRFDCANNPPRV